MRLSTIVRWAIVLSFHGGSRRTMELCVLCHTPQTVDPDSGNTVDMPVMVHRIHTGHELTIPYAFSATTNFAEVGYPGDRRKCDACHVGGSELLPLKGTGRVGVVDPSGYLNPAGPVAAACTSCHTSKAAASHALANTNALGEGCAACHGEGAEFSVTRAHAR